MKKEVQSWKNLLKIFSTCTSFPSNLFKISVKNSNSKSNQLSHRLSASRLTSQSQQQLVHRENPSQNSLMISRSCIVFNKQSKGGISELFFLDLFTHTLEKFSNIVYFYPVGAGKQNAVFFLFNICTVFHEIFNVIPWMHRNSSKEAREKKL